LAICGTCGSKNAKGVKYCSECGTQIPVESVSTKEKSQTPKPKLFKNKFMVFGGGGILAAVLVLVLVLVLTPFKIEEDTVQGRLLSTEEVQMPMTIDETPYNSLEDETYIFGIDDNCRADIDAAELLEKSGRIMASISFKDSSNYSNKNYLEEVLVEFESSEQAREFVGFARSGFNDDGCREKDNLFGGFGKAFYDQSGGGSLSQSVGGDESSSFSFIQETQFFSRFANNDAKWERNVALAAKGQYVVMVVATVEIENPTELSAQILKDYAPIAIKKVFK
jgi:hypothetical protein